MLESRLRHGTSSPEDPPAASALGTPQFGSSTWTNLVGVSAWAAEMRREIEVVGRHAVTAIIHGPSGTGKELIARSIHESGPRRSQPFVPIDCASVADTLFAAQMFGHEKGAFTGASSAAIGAFRAADGGTLFLDELGELELEAQARLLRVLQERVVVPVGGLREIPVNVRVIAATNRDLTVEVAAGRFREDLYYRLSVAALRTTPLRTRPEDIGPLIEALSARIEVRHGIRTPQFSAEAWEALGRYDWPGNVRELNNVLERAFLYCEHQRLELHHLPEVVQRAVRDDDIIAFDVPATLPATAKQPESDWPTMAEVERQHMLAALKHTNFNQTAAARLLGLDRHALRRSLRRLNIQLPAKRAAGSGA